MGVHGLWKLLEPSGKPVTLESLDNKVLAIDVSMWLHQVMKGYQDSTGNALPNAHLLGLFHRICKLLFYKIRPVFVFDGGVPQLKQQTMAARRNQRSRAARQAERDRLRLLQNLAEQGAVRQALGAAVSRPAVSTSSKKPSAFADYILEPIPEAEGESSEEESEGEVEYRPQPLINWDNFDPESDAFKKLPAKEKLEILTDLQESRKQNSWARIHEMPQESSEFSGFQLKRLLVRHSAQVGLEQVEQELGETHTLTMAQLEEMMKEKGSLAAKLDNMSQDAGRRIASDTSTRFLLLKSQSQGELEKGKLLTTGQGATSQTPIEVDLTDETEEDITPITPQDNNEVLSQKAILDIITKSKKSTPTMVLDPNKPSTSSAGYYQPISTELTIPEDLSAICNAPISNILPEELVKSIASIKVPQKTPSQVNSDKVKNSERLINKFNGDISILPSTVQSKNAVCITKETKQTQRNNIKISPEMSPPEVCKRSSVLEPEEINRDTEKSAETKQNSAVKSSAEIMPITDLNNDKTVVELEEINCSTEGNAEANKKDNLMVKNSVTESNNASQDLKHKEEFTKNTVDLLASKVVEKPAKSTAPVEAMEVQVMSDSDSNDAFEEVPEVEPEEKSALEIQISKDIAAPSDDIFADVFESCETKQDVIQTITDSETSEVSGDEIATEPAVASTQPKVNTQDLMQLEAALASQGRELASEAGRQERLAATISDQMCLEAQQLLQLFGLPYIVAPMEAEAQCAMLDLLALTNGTVTDDSDIWLFGGKTVYRNFFNQARNVEMYTADAIQRCFKLSRSQLVLLAMLVGSDYTTGLVGVGPVTALEILAAFPTPTAEQQSEELVKPLCKFREWWSERDKQSVSSKLKKLATKLRDLSLHEGFPSTAVADAYLHPAVDDSREVFSWGRPDVPALIKFTKEKFGWNQKRCENILNPVLKRLEDSSVQKKIDSYFTVGPKAQNVEGQLSSRVRQAVSQLGDVPEEEEEEDAPAVALEDEQPAEKPVKAPRQRRAPQGQLSTLEAMRKALTKKPRKKPLDFTAPVAKKPVTPNPSTSKLKEERIPQRERDKESALQSKLKAIELFRKRKIDPPIKPKKPKRVTKDEHYLSDSNSDD